ncbi:hypothetical protein D3C73_984990 [compost metagenome]
MRGAVHPQIAGGAVLPLFRSRLFKMAAGFIPFIEIDYFLDRRTLLYYRVRLLLQRLLCKQDTELRMLRDIFDPVSGIHRIKRHISRSRLQDPQNSGQHETARERQNADQALRTHPL